MVEIRVPKEALYIVQHVDVAEAKDESRWGWDVVHFIVVLTFFIIYFFGGLIYVKISN